MKAAFMPAIVGLYLFNKSVSYMLKGIMLIYVNEEKYVLTDIICQFFDGVTILI
jgi:hypothetical protein